MNWIKCEDKLPDIWEMVIIYGQEIGVAEGYRVEYKPLDSTWWRYLSSDHKDLEEAKNKEVTHWMFLPAKPEG